MMETEKLNDLKNTETEKDTNFQIEDGNKDGEDLFDSLIQEIGKNGKFQTRINYLYNLVFVILLTMPFTNYILAMTIPDHWCYVPEREITNNTVQEWKEQWIPKYVTSYAFCKY